MGEMEVPADALYGAQTARAVANFPISGLRAHPAFVDATVRVKLAAARANAKLGLLPREKARAIEAAAREVLGGPAPRAVRRGRVPGRRGHLAQHERERGAREPRDASSSAAGAGDARSSTRTTTSTWRSRRTTSCRPRSGSPRSTSRRPSIEALAELAGTFEEKARAWDGIVKSGRTHLMDATPIRLGQEVSGWAAALRAAGGPGPRRAAGAVGARASAAPRSAPASTPHPRYAKLVVAELERAHRRPAHARAEPVLRDAVARAVRGALRGAAHRGARAPAHRRRRAAPRQRPEHRPRRAEAPARAARVVHHAGQGEPLDGGDARDGLVPGHRDGRRRRLGRRAAGSSS